MSSPHCGAPETPLTKCVMCPELLNKSLGRSLVETVTRLDSIRSAVAHGGDANVVVATCVVYGCVSLACQLIPSSEKVCAETVELVHDFLSFSLKSNACQSAWKLPRWSAVWSGKGGGGDEEGSKVSGRNA